jgi:hypothetical protein
MERVIPTDHLTTMELGTKGIDGSLDDVGRDMRARPKNEQHVDDLLRR